MHLPPDLAPKLSPELFQAYKSYKCDTDRLATWLADTARSIGFDFNPSAKSTSNPPSAPAPRLKGKARKAAKAEAEAASTTRSRHDSGISLDPEIPAATSITVPQFIACAKYISKSDPPVSVPTRVIDWVCRAIEARQVCARWFQGPAQVAAAPAMPDAPDTADNNHNVANQDYDHGVERAVGASPDESNRTHAYFIGVLTHVAAILAPRVGANHSRNLPVGKGTSRKPAGIELIESRFAALADGSSTTTSTLVDESSNDWDAVFELIQETLNSKSAKRSSPRKSNREREGPDFSILRRKYQVKCQHEDEQDFLFVLMELFASLDMLLQELGRAWEQYILGHLHQHSRPGALEHPSLLSLAVCDKVLDMCNDLTKLFPTLMLNHGKYARLIFEHACADHDLKPWASSPSGEKKVFGLKAWRLATYCNLPTITVLERFRKSVQSGTVRRLDKPEDTKCPCCDGDEKRQRDHIDYLEYLVNELYLDYQAAEELNASFAIQGVPNPVINALESLKTLPPSDPIPIWVLFVIQVHLNVTYIFSHAPEGSRNFIHRDVSHTVKQHMYAIQEYNRHPPSTSGELYIPGTAKNMTRAIWGLYLWLAYPLPGDDADAKSGDAGSTDSADGARVTGSAQGLAASEGDPTTPSRAGKDSPKQDFSSDLRARRAAIHRVFDVHPIFAGTVTARAGSCMSVISVTLADRWQCLLNSVYLYEAMRLLGLDQDTARDGANAGANAGQENGPSTARDGREARRAIGIKESIWWQLMEEFVASIGKSRIFFGKEPADIHSLWRTLNLTIENPSRTDLVFREHLSKHRNGHDGGLPRSLRRIVDKHPCRPNPSSMVTLRGLITNKSKELVGWPFIDRLGFAVDGKSDKAVQVKAAVSSLEQLVSPRIVPSNHEELEQPEYRATRHLRFYVEHLSAELRDAFVPLLVPNVLLLHVQSVRILKHLREQILVYKRIEMLDKDCPSCRRRDTHLPASLWNLIRALGGEEVTMPVLGVAKTRREKKAALALLGDVKKFIIETFE